MTKKKLLEVLSALGGLAAGWRMQVTRAARTTPPAEEIVLVTFDQRRKGGRLQAKLIKMLEVVGRFAADWDLHISPAPDAVHARFGRERKGARP